MKPCFQGSTKGTPLRRMPKNQPNQVQLGSAAPRSVPIRHSEDYSDMATSTKPAEFVVIGTQISSKIVFEY